VTITLPADIEPFLTDGVEWSDPGVYCLELTGPHTDWSDVWDTKPAWWPRADAAAYCLYVGAASNVLRRLEDHVEGEHRTATLVSICEIAGLETVEWGDNPREADEYNLAARLDREHERAYVHQR
jgi:predicted GIY-YIG superfamily endonuclease